MSVSVGECRNYNSTRTAERLDRLQGLYPIFLFRYRSNDYVKPQAICSAA